MRFSGCALEDEDPPAAMCARIQGSLFSAKEGANFRRIWEIFDRLNGREVLSLGFHQFWKASHELKMGVEYTILL